MSNIEEIENYNTFTQRVMKQIVSKDDEETRKLLIKYAKEKYPKDEVRIDFYDEEIVKKIISLGITEYIKTQNDLYKIMVLGEFNTTTNNIEEDIKIVEELLKDFNCKEIENTILFREKANAIENILNEYKKIKKEHQEAYRKANNYLYFKDSADYEVALWEVIRSLRPDLAEKWDKGEYDDLHYIEEE